MRTLLQVIDKHDRDQNAKIEELTCENGQLEKKVKDLTNQLVSYVGTVDKMKLDLILLGALQRPPGSPKPEIVNNLAMLPLHRLSTPLITVADYRYALEATLKVMRDLLEADSDDARVAAGRWIEACQRAQVDR